MYYDHFRLKEAPFKITPNTDFFYEGANRGAVLDALIYAIVTGEGIIKVVGEVGSGKTMLCRMLQDKLPDTVENVYLANPSVAPEDVLHVLAFELQLKVPKNADRIKVMQLLQDHLIKRHAEGKKVVIFVEEAQGMPIETLEEIRLLTNLETKQDKLLQIVLFGQPELDDNLNQNSIRQLRERITHSFYLTPFDKTDIGPYIESRLRKAGYAGPPLFTRDALALLSRASEGLVRRANILADKALLSTFSENAYQVTRRNVLAAIKDSEFGREMGKGHMLRKWLIRFAVLLIVAGLAGGLYTAWQNNKLSLHLPDWFASDATTKAPAPKAPQEKTQNANVTPSAEPANRIIAAPAVTPTAPAAASAGGYDPATDATLTNPQPANALSTSVSTTSALATSTAAATDKPNANTNASTATNKTPNVTTADTTPTTAPDTQKNTNNNALNASALSDAMLTKLASSKEWFSQQSSNTHVIQLMGVPEAQLETQLNLVAKHLDVSNLHMYQKEVKGQAYVTLVYGSYADKNEAISAIDSLPHFIKSNAPYIRTIGGISKEIKLLQ